MVQQMKDLGFTGAALPYNVLLNLYYKSGNHEKINSLVQEMDEKGICYDRFTYDIWLSACVVDSNMTGITDILTRIASDAILCNPVLGFSLMDLTFIKKKQGLHLIQKLSLIG
ncbi:Pentatricopeptide repeat [Trema orientale]|uniref:Pentatricopeptide repeat n=1 Tax=Trema orientale TaxID=63057 RepID=A0A2P5EA42_TREOI|nr:Pentatricopeptide repeat [Trema orientale]